MSILTRGEFAGSCNVSEGYLNVYIGRKKVAVHGKGNKLIDTENPLNVIFVKELKRRQKEKAKGIKATPTKPASKPAAQPSTEQIYNEVVEKVDVEETIYTEKETPAQKKKREQQNDDDSEYTGWELRKKIADTLKAERAAEKAQLEIEKMMGNLMPVELVMQILTVNIKDIFLTFETDLENLASIYCDILAGGDRTKLAQIMVKLREKLTSNIKRVETTAAKEVDNIVNEYSQQRGVGQRN
ncbi:MAG: hypothetical protein V4547_16230 [Bacteroidota bacterium]